VHGSFAFGFELQRKLPIVQCKFPCADKSWITGLSSEVFSKTAAVITPMAKPQLE
jgi:hypothetical protein